MSLEAMQGLWDAAWPYFSLFLAGLSSITVIFPTVAVPAAFAAGAAGLNVWLVALATGLGSAVGEMSTYVAALAGERFLLKKYRKEIKSVEKSFQKHNPEAIIFLFSATPLPIDVVGAACGAMEYPWHRFFLSCLAGKLVKFLILAYAGALGAEWVHDLLNWG